MFIKFEMSFINKVLLLIFCFSVIVLFSLFSRLSLSSVISFVFLVFQVGTKFCDKFGFPCFQGRD